MRIKHGEASVHLSQVDGGLLAHDLEGYGSPTDLLALVRQVAAMTEAGPIFLHIDLRNPKAGKLMKLYKRFGWRECALILKAGGS